MTPHQAIVNHLKDTDGQVAPGDLVEKNSNLFYVQWNPEKPGRNIWLHIRNCQVFVAPIEPNTKSTAMHLTLTIFEHTSVFAFAVEKWYADKPVSDHMLPNFTSHFTFENKELICKQNGSSVFSPSPKKDHRSEE